MQVDSASKAGEKLTVLAWSTEMGMSRQAGYAALKRCEIPVEGGLVDRDIATMLYRRRTRARANERRGGEGQTPPAAGESSAITADDGDNYWVSRARREQAEAELAELKLAEQRGLLVRAADVRAALAKNIASLREGFLQLPSRLVPLLVVESDPAKLDGLLRQEIHAVLAQLTEGAA
jgi:hypothetical protein